MSAAPPRVKAPASSSAATAVSRMEWRWSTEGVELEGDVLVVVRVETRAWGQVG